MERYYAGTTVTVPVTFIPSPGAAPIDPTTVTAKIINGDGSLLTWVYSATANPPLIAKTAVGMYYLALLTVCPVSNDPPGTMYTATIEWIGTGACSVVNVYQFLIEKPPL